MALSLEAVREFEAEYYEQMPQGVRDMAKLRDEGIQQVRNSTSDLEQGQGLDMLSDSVKGLQTAKGYYEREHFASIYMLANGQMISGDHEYAGVIAERAMGFLPGVPREFAKYIKADQYRPIACGRLALMIAASIDNNLVNPRQERWNQTSQMLAKKSAIVAIKTARFSENRNRMLFANGGMSDSERREARRRHEVTAAAALASLWLPGQQRRVALARKFCV